MAQHVRLRRVSTTAVAWIAAALLAGGTGLSVTMPAQASEARAVPDAGGPVGPTKGDPLADVGTGMLFWNHPRARLPLPMLDLQVELTVSGSMVHGTVLQVFENPTEESIEALYVFPLPERAAVHHMEIRIGERRIVSVIREKQEARRTYEKAKKEGRKAALLEQDRPNLFTTAVAGINPGETVQVHLEYVEDLLYDDGRYALAFPLTYTTRYGGPNGGDVAPVHRDPSDRPGDAPVDAVGVDEINVAPEALVGTVVEHEVVHASMSSAASHPDRGSASSRPALAFPHARLTIRLDAGMPLEDLDSVSHEVDTRWDGDVLVVEPAGGHAVLADRDFLLSYRPQVGHEPRGALLTEDRKDGRYALLMVLPPVDPAATTGLSTETVFVVDVSGSMAGPSIRQARQALHAAIERLHPDDGFNIVAFSNSVRVMARDYVPAGPAERSWAHGWIDGLRAGGGTRLDLALDTAAGLVERGETWRVERVVLLTDGAVSFEDALLEKLHARLGNARLHTLGIGAAPNRYLMRTMASAGRGLCDFIARVDEAENRIDGFLTRLSRPVMTDIRLTWEGETPLEVYPAALPDLHAGEPLHLAARFAPGTGPARLILEGRVDGGTVRTVLDVDDGSERPTGIATRWARARVDDLIGGLHRGENPDVVRAAVIDVSKRFGIVTRFTSLVAVEEFPTVAGDSRTVRVPAATLLQGQLPLGGTREPLLRLLTLALALAAGVAGFGGHCLRRRRQAVRS